MDDSAGLLLYRHSPDLEVFLGHFGGPYWQNTDAGAWTMPKGQGTLQNTPKGGVGTDLGVPLRTA